MRAFWPMVALLVMPGAARAQVVINEVMSDPTGADTGHEWVELYNKGGSSVDLSGWGLQRGKTSFTVTPRYVIPQGTSLAAGDYLVIGDEFVVEADLKLPAEATLDLGNGSNGDGVRLIDENQAVLDTVIYGGSNTDNLPGDAGFAPDTPEGQTVSRSPNGADTDNSTADFVAGAPTIGAMNPTVSTTCTPATGVVINEVLNNPEGTDTGKEYVELYNASGASVNLNGWELQAGTSSFATKVTLSNLDFADGEFVLIGEAQVAGADATATLTLGNASSNADAVRLIDCQGNVLDTVVYGATNPDGFVDDSGNTATSLAPVPGDGEALARRIDGVDSNLSAIDFVKTLSLTPGARNPAPPVCEQSTSSIVINEFLPNPAGSDTGFEWIELHNRSSNHVRLDGWTLRAATQGNTFSVKHTFGANRTIPAGGFFLFGEAAVSATDETGVLALGNGSGGDGVRLVDCVGNVVDTVVYGGDNEDEVLDDSGFPAISVAPLAGDGASLMRKADGLDTDASGADFAVSTNPTPGAANPVLTCTPSNGDVLLNELLTDPEGADSTAATEWVELYNRGDGPVDIDGWALVTANSGDDEAIDVILPPSSTIASQGFFVIGNAAVAEADYETTFAIGNGSGADAVRLLDCAGNLVDVVIYGDTNEDGLKDENGLVAEPSANPGSNQALARVEDGADTNAASDWTIDPSPSPGATNVQEVVDVPDVDEGSGCGRRGQAPDADAPEGGGCGTGAPDPETPSGCTTAPLPFGGLELFPLVFALRRRRA